jgi:hypothetical protein
MKYEIIKNGTDDYTLKFKDKEFNYKPDVELASKLQAAPKQARIEMLKDLAKDGISLKDFTIEEKKQGKTYFDNTNKIELEKTYIENKMLEIIDKVCKEKFNLDFTNLLIEIGLETQEEQELFAKELGATLTGKTPS